MRRLAKNTAANVLIFLTDSADRSKGKKGADPQTWISKNGGVFSEITPDVTELDYGWYAVALTTGNTDTVGELALHFEADGADPADIDYTVIADIYQAKVFPVNGAPNDDYLIAWFKNGIPITTGMTDVTIQVTRGSDGTDLIAESSATEVGALGVFKYTSAVQMEDGQPYIIISRATIDSAERSWYQPYGNV